ncbi:selenide, water dikinase SelD [Anoxybacter fermentans]|uniref:Selenide, water dikinase n=1 Tax=Anoxybacter fermentans TaxID=1323375 RepID=A0A3Q9HSU7_9FIRM|nr:selenide, water dikinase SelD [Anoxybacter fermentans]
MCQLPQLPVDKRLIVGPDTADDAGVFILNEEMALIQTLDYFTPIVDDPYTFGQIAAANALSDVYAMGGYPITALNIVGFSPKKLPLEVLAQILAGGADKVAEAGACIAGGHTIDDPEPKYGLSVAGLVHPKKVLTNAGAKVGDKLVLTKPLGIGIITTAIKKGLASDDVIEEAVEVMTTLNKDSAEAMQEVGVNACTDITGFGLLGHAYEMAKASDVGIRIYKDKVPVLPATYEYALQNVFPGGTRANLKYLADKVEFAEGISEMEQLILSDAITSGGLLISVPEERVEELITALKARKGVITTAIIGDVVAEHPQKLKVEV